MGDLIKRPLNRNSHDSLLHCREKGKLVRVGWGVGGRRGAFATERKLPWERGGGEGEFPRTIYPAAAAAIPERLNSPPSAEIEWRGGSLKQGLLNALFDPRIEGGWLTHVGEEEQNQGWKQEEPPLMVEHVGWWRPPPTLCFPTHFRFFPRTISVFGKGKSFFFPCYDRTSVQTSSSHNGTFFFFPIACANSKQEKSGPLFSYDTFPFLLLFFDQTPDSISHALARRANNNPPSFSVLYVLFFLEWNFFFCRLESSFRRRRRRRPSSSSSSSFTRGGGSKLPHDANEREERDFSSLLLLPTTLSFPDFFIASPFIGTSRAQTLLFLLEINLRAYVRICAQSTFSLFYQPTRILLLPAYIERKGKKEWVNNSFFVLSSMHTPLVYCFLSFLSIQERGLLLLEKGRRGAFYLFLSRSLSPSFSFHSPLPSSSLCKQFN